MIFLQLFMDSRYASATAGCGKIVPEFNVSRKAQVANFTSGKRAVAFVCLLLTLAAALGEASHIHLKAEAAGSPIRCSICVAAHTARPASICEPMRTARVFAPFVQRRTPDLVSRLATCDLSVRPPPAAS